MPKKALIDVAEEQKEKIADVYNKLTDIFQKLDEIKSTLEEIRANTAPP